MKRFRLWLPSLLMAVVLALGVAVQGNVAVTAAGPGTFPEVSPGFYRDPRCDDANRPFWVSLYRDTNYQGTRWDLCSGYTSFCFIPHGSDSSPASLCLAGFDGSTMNDYPSSVRFREINGGELCRVNIHEHANHGGAALRRYDPVNIPSLVPWPNDALSSIRREC